MTDIVTTQTNSQNIRVPSFSEGRYFFTLDSNSTEDSSRVQLTLEAGARASVLLISSYESDVQKSCHFEFDLKRDASVEFVEMGLGVTKGSTSVKVNLLESGAEAYVSGVHLLKGSEVYQTKVEVHHQAADTLSRQNFKCVVSDRAHSLFGGRIVIEQDAQRVDSSQEHKALLIAKGAKSSAFPELEVRADDVKAAHGSSTGQMDPEQLFYLKSRGLTDEESIHLLSEAFVKDIILKMKDSLLREKLELQMDLALPEFVQGMEHQWLQK